MSHLILQSPCLRAENVEQIAAMANADGVQYIGNTIARLLKVDLQPDEQLEIIQKCEAFGMDYALLESVQRLSDCKVLAMDMDSTLINIECIDEIADIAGRKEQVAAITEAAMRGEISDFAQSLRQRVALLEGVPAAHLDKVYADRLHLNAGAQELIKRAHMAGIKTLLVSGGFTFFTEKLKDRLRLHEAHANTLEIKNGLLTGKVLGPIVDAQGKADHLTALAKSLNATADQIIAIGDGANDLKMLAMAGYSVAYRAKPIVRQQTRFAINFSGLDAVLNWFRSH